MNDRNQPSLAVRIFGPLFFCATGIGALWWFFDSVYAFLQALSSDVVLFDKGSFYMLGVSAGLLTLAFVGIQESWLGKDLTKRQAAMLTKVGIASVILMLLTPHAIHYFAHHALTRKGYSVCEEASHQWLFVSNIIYVSGHRQCDASLSPFPV